MSLWVSWTWTISSRVHWPCYRPKRGEIFVYSWYTGEEVALRLGACLISRLLLSMSLDKISTFTFLLRLYLHVSMYNNTCLLTFSWIGVVIRLFSSRTNQKALGKQYTNSNFNHRDIILEFGENILHLCVLNVIVVQDHISIHIRDQCIQRSC